MRVLVVDDDPDLRLLVRLTLESAGGFTIVGEAGDGGAAAAAAASLRPDVVVLDLGLPDLPGLDVLGTLRHVAPDARIVVFSGLDHDGTRSAALSGGAASYVLKDADMQVLLSALHDLDVPTRTATIELDNDIRSIAAARTFARDWCAQWALDELTESALLVASELVTNAVRHANSKSRLRLDASSDALRFEVHDFGDGTPAPQAVDERSPGGRGLYIVASLCRSWGVDSTPDGKVVWAELPR